GLGRLAACLLDSMANLGLPAYGYGIRYDCGLFTQSIEDGWQVERPDTWLRHGNPWEIPRRELVYRIPFGGRVIAEGASGRRWLPDEEILATAYDLPVPGRRSEHVNTLRLWSPLAAQELDLGAFNAGEHGRAF